MSDVLQDSQRKTEADVVQTIRPVCGLEVLYILLFIFGSYF